MGWPLMFPHYPGTEESPAAPGGFPFPLLSPESLQPNLTLGSQTWVTPSQFFSSLESMQSVSPSQRQRMGMHSPSSRHWNSSVWQPPGGRVAAGRAPLTACTPRSWGAPGMGGDHALSQQGKSWRHPEAQEGDLGTECGLRRRQNSPPGSRAALLGAGFGSPGDACGWGSLRRAGAHPGWCSWRGSHRCSHRSRCPRHRSSARGCSARCCT